MFLRLFFRVVGLQKDGSAETDGPRRGCCGEERRGRSGGQEPAAGGLGSHVEHYSIAHGEQRSKRVFYLRYPKLVPPGLALHLWESRARKARRGPNGSARSRRL